MAWAAVDKNGQEVATGAETSRGSKIWKAKGVVELPKGSIEKLIDRKLSLEDEPVELKEEE